MQHIHIPDLAFRFYAKFHPYSRFPKSEILRLGQHMDEHMFALSFRTPVDGAKCPIISLDCFGNIFNHFQYEPRHPYLLHRKTHEARRKTTLRSGF